MVARKVSYNVFYRETVNGKMLRTLSDSVTIIYVYRNKNKSFFINHLNSEQMEVSYL